MDVRAEMVEQRELARFVRGLEYDRLPVEGLREIIGERGLQTAVIVEETDALGAFPRLDNELERAGVESAMTLVDPFGDRVLGERAGVFLAQFELDVEAVGGGLGDDLPRIEVEVDKALTALDSGHADIGAEVQVGR